MLPLILSLPSPPTMTSLPPPPESVSFPASPKMKVLRVMAESIETLSLPDSACTTMLPLKLNVPLFTPLIFTTALPCDEPDLVTVMVSLPLVPKISMAVSVLLQGSVMVTTLFVGGGAAATFATLFRVAVLPPASLTDTVIGKLVPATA